MTDFEKQDLIKSSIESGKKYGYPKCCTNFFINVSVGNVTKKKLINACYKAAFINGVYSGFFPCPNCLKKLRQGKELKDIIINRDLSLSEFPNDWSLK